MPKEDTYMYLEQSIRGWQGRAAADAWWMAFYLLCTCWV